MTVLALAVGSADLSGAGWVHGLELVAAPVVATAVLGMQRSLAPGLVRLALAAAAAGVAIAWGGFAGQAAAIALGAIVGIALFRNQALPPRLTTSFAGGRLMATGCILAFAALLLGLPALADTTDAGAIALFDAMFRSGSLVFGGGHVVLPLLHEAVVAPGWVSQQEFLAGYGLAQAMPGPLFTFSAYLGAIQEPSPNGVPGAALAVGAIFLPSFLLLGGVLPLWSSIRRHAAVQAALAGVGAAVVGLLAAALWDPVLKTSIDDWADVVFALALLALLRLLPVWAVVPIAAAAGALLL
jgi:chromate transporter